MKDWLANRSGREQVVLALGASVVAVALVYVLVFEPLHGRLAEARRQVQAEAVLLAYVRGAAAEAAALRRMAAPGRVSDAGQPLLSVVNASAAEAGIDAAIRLVTPDGGGLRVTFDAVAFDPLIAWLTALAGERGVQVSGISIERLPEPGRVRATLALAAGTTAP